MIELIIRLVVSIDYMPVQTVSEPHTTSLCLEAHFVHAIGSFPTAAECT